MPENVDTLEKDIREIKETQRAIYKILNGNGKIGLVTKVALLGASLGRAWAALWVVIVGLFAIAFYAIRGNIVQ